MSYFNNGQTIQWPYEKKDTMVHKTLPRKQNKKIAERTPITNWLKSASPEKYTISVPLMAPVLLLLIETMFPFH